jgi:deferrochelatase/peroxidase EfeB
LSPLADPRRRRLRRRARLGAAGSARAGIALGGERLERALGDSGGAAEIPFHGRHQAGIATPAQDRLHFAAFDLTTDRRSDLRDLLRSWSDAAARMCAGLPVGDENGDPDAPPDDTGESLGLGPARLTLTFGLGPSLFARAGDDRFGLAARRPAPLVELPPFAGDALDPRRSGGDLSVQACGDDPQIVFHAVRNLARLGRGVTVLRWSQLGFGRTASTSRAQATPRNLMGFKDGTNNLKLEDADALREHVWVGGRDEPGWLRDGSYVVIRRIRMLLEVWDRSTLADQERTIGRSKLEGAPLGAVHEHDPVPLAERGPDGGPIVPADAHIRLGGPPANGGARILRRGYSFTDGVDQQLGQLDAGLFFVSYQRDPRRFVDIQQRLARNDALNQYISHTGSAIFACPPGARPGSYVGAGLFA